PDGFNNAAIYIIQNGARSWIPDMQTFNALGLAMGAVHRISWALLSQIPLGPSIPSEEGLVAQQQSQSATVAPTPTTVPAPASSATTINTTAAGTVSSVLQPGAAYNASTGYYTNPDGSIYYPSSAASAAVDWSSP